MVVYAYLMGVYLPRIPGFAPPVHPVALQVFDTLETTRLRLDLLRKLAEWTLKDATLLDELKGPVVESIHKAGRLRNTLIHAQWGVAKEYPDALILQPVFGHQMVYEESDFNDAIDRIIQARAAIGQFETKARKLIG